MTELITPPGAPVAAGVHLSDLGQFAGVAAGR